MNEVELFSKGYVVIPIDQYNKLLLCYNATRADGKDKLLEVPKLPRSGNLADENEQKSQKETPNKPKKEIEEIKNGRKSVDHGKINALYKAGWSVEEIAKEIDASSSTVYMHIEELKERRRK